MSEAETNRFGAALAEALRPGCVVALNGDLGAGKTRIAQAVAEALGEDRLNVGSPTFVLVHEYETRLPVYHFDTYRLRDTDEFLELGAEEMLHGCGICLIEWAERVAEVLPRDRLEILIESEGPTTRVFRLCAGGKNSAGVLGRVRAALEA